MKVNHPSVDLSTPTDRIASDMTRPLSKRAGAAAADAVSLSGDLRLADEAVRAAAVSGNVRPAAVEAARALLASGQLGADLDRLADRMIDSLTQAGSDDHT
jgi:anti-sigma28 factor (negative regulator of flagellin synthesis)